VSSSTTALRSPSRAALGRRPHRGRPTGPADAVCDDSRFHGRTEPVRLRSPRGCSDASPHANLGCPGSSTPARDPSGTRPSAPRSPMLVPNRPRVERARTGAAPTLRAAPAAHCAHAGAPADGRLATPGAAHPRRTPEATQSCGLDVAWVSRRGEVAARRTLAGPPRSPTVRCGEVGKCEGLFLDDGSRFSR